MKSSGKNNDDFFGTMFDFNGDGKTTLDEQYLAYKIYEETMREKESKNHNAARKNSFNINKKTYSANRTKKTCSEKSKKTGLAVSAISVIGILLFVFVMAMLNNTKNGGQSKTYSYSSRTYSSYSSSLSTASAYRKSEAIDVPYVGMSESKISDTLLGTPSSKVRHNYEVKNGEQLLANLYDFYKDGACVFTARCVQGSVTQVWDKRDDPVKPHKSYSSKSRSSKSQKSDPFSATDYVDADDFYYDHYDDFYDYEDAEDYYNEHND